MSKALEALDIIEESLQVASDMSTCLIEYELGEGLSPDVTDQREKMVKAYVTGLQQIKTIRTALTSQTWQGIESAPIDTDVLLYSSKRKYIVIGYHDGYNNPNWRNDQGEIFNPPTHWMPLPNPPQEK